MTDSDWQPVFEKVEPHGLCCADCKARAVLLADTMDELTKHGSVYRDQHGEYISERKADALLARFADLENRTSSEGMGNREHLSSAQAAAHPDPEDLEGRT